MFGTQQRALRAGLAAAAMIGLAVAPTAVMAHNGASSDPDAAVAAQLAPRTDPLEALAKALGVKPEELKAAMQVAREASQKQLVTTFAATLKLDVAKVQAALDAMKPQRDGDEGRGGDRFLKRRHDGEDKGKQDKQDKPNFHGFGQRFPGQGNGPKDQR